MIPKQFLAGKVITIFMQQTQSNTYNSRKKEIFLKWTKNQHSCTSLFSGNVYKDCKMLFI